MFISLSNMYRARGEDISSLLLQGHAGISGSVGIPLDRVGEFPLVHLDSKQQDSLAGVQLPLHFVLLRQYS